MSPSRSARARPASIPCWRSSRNCRYAAQDVRCIAFGFARRSKGRVGGKVIRRIAVQLVIALPVGDAEDLPTSADRFCRFDTSGRHIRCASGRDSPRWNRTSCRDSACAGADRCGDLARHMRRRSSNLPKPSERSFETQDLPAPGHMLGAKPARPAAAFRGTSTSRSDPEIGFDAGDERQPDGLKARLFRQARAFLETIARVGADPSQIHAQLL